MTPTEQHWVRKLEPGTGIIHILVSEGDGTVTIRPLGVADQRTITYGEWMSWLSHDWLEASS